MGYAKLQQIIVTVPRRLEPAFTMHLRTLVGQWPTSWSPMDDDRAEISLFLPARQGTVKLLKSLRAYHAILKELGLAPGTIKLKKRFIRVTDWARAWRASFEPVQISPNFVVKPTWAKWPAHNDQIVIQIDPTLAFGTGHHPTTSFCLRMIERLSPKNNGNGNSSTPSMLDCGCGTGILVIAATRLGYGPAIGFDYDRDAIRVARANMKLNETVGKMEIVRSTLEAFDPAAVPVKVKGTRGRTSIRKFDVVTANLAADLLTKNARKISGMVKPAGTLVLAGVLDRDARSVSSVYCQLGWRRFAQEIAGGWTSWAMRRT